MECRLGRSIWDLKKNLEKLFLWREQIIWQKWKWGGCVGYITLVRVRYKMKRILDFFFSLDTFLKVKVTGLVVNSAQHRGKVAIRLTLGSCLELLVDYGCCAVLSLSVMSDSCDPMDFNPPGSSVLGDSPGKNTGVDCHAFLQGVFPNQELNPGLPYCRWILYHLSHLRSPSILDW